MRAQRGLRPAREAHRRHDRHQPDRDEQPDLRVEDRVVEIEGAALRAEEQAQQAADEQQRCETAVGAVELAQAMQRIAADAGAAQHQLGRENGERAEDRDEVQVGEQSIFPHGRVLGCREFCS